MQNLQCQLEKQRAEHESLSSEFNRVSDENQELLNRMNQFEMQNQEIRLKHEKEVAKLNSKLNKSKSELDCSNSEFMSRLEEINHLKSRQAKINEELQKQL